MILYDAILEGYEAETEQDAIDYASGICSDWEASEQPMPKYNRYIDTVNGIDVYYDFGADYYFFAESEQ